MKKAKTIKPKKKTEAPKEENGAGLAIDLERDKTMVEARVRANKLKLLENLELSLGIVTTACRNSGLSRETFYAYIKDDPVFAQCVAEVKDIKHDFVESKLLQAIKEGREASIIFYCKTQMRHRGYVERVENINLNLASYDLLRKDPDLLTPDELQQAITVIEAQAIEDSKA